MFFNKAAAEGGGFAIDKIVDISLTPHCDRFGLVPGNSGIAHSGKQLFQHDRVLMGELDKFKAVRASRIFRADLGDGIVWKRSHSNPLW